MLQSEPLVPRFHHDAADNELSEAKFSTGSAILMKL